MASEVVHNREEQRFELKQGDEVAYAEYEREGETIIFTHTVVPPALEGHGIGTELVRAGLAAVREAGGKVVPACPFVARYIERHPEDRELLDPAYVDSQQGLEDI